MRTKKNGILTLFLAFLVHICFAQEKTISGVVKDHDGLPLPGVNVLVQGTTNGSQTNFDGNYLIKGNIGQTLIFTYIGQKEVKKLIKTSNSINIQMEEDAEALDEVVVVAYGTQSRASLTGALSVIDAKQIENATFSNPVKSLEGLVSGLRIVQGSGVPGSDPIIRIRGFGSINGDAQPLIVLDGIPYTGSLSSINPRDIESTTVLKDASATSLYGNKAGNGVLLITTKKGSKRKTQISIDTRVGVTNRGAKEYNIIGTPKKFYESYHSVLTNSEFYRTNNTNGVTPLTIEQSRQFATDNLIDRLGYNLYNVPNNLLIDPTTGKLNTNAQLQIVDKWEDALFRDNANFNSTNLNISGGSDDIDYYFSVGTEENNGYTVGSNFKRKTTRLKLNTAKIAKIFSLSGNVSYATSKSQAVPSTFDINNAPSTNFANAFFWNRRIAPIYPVFQYDQNWNPILDANNSGGIAYDFGNPQIFPDGSSRGPRNYAPGEHPLAVIDNSIQTTKRDNFNGALRAKVDLPLDIKFEYVLNLLTEVDKGISYRGPGAGSFAKAQNGLLTNTRDNFSVLTNQQLLTWKKNTNNNSFDILLGHETYEEKFTRLSLTKYNVVGDFAPITDFGSVYNSSINYNTKYLTEGYFSRFVYGLNDTYFLNLSGRYDASSVFHPDSRWGFFWSTGGAWVLSNESFLKDSKVVNYAKLTASYGTSGNDRLFYPGSPTGRRNLLLYEDQFIVGENNGDIIAEPSPSFLGGKKDATWESTASFDVAYETRLFNRLNLSVGYYRKETEKLLFNTPLSPSTSVDSRPSNSGTMINSGIETEVALDIIKKEKLNISLNANLSTIKNEITKLPRDDRPITVDRFRREVGKSIYDYYMVKFAGVNPDNGNATYYTIDDTTGDKIITENYADAAENGREFIGKSAIPDITGGFGTNIQMGKFSLGLQFAYQFGGHGIDSEYFSLLGATQNTTNLVDFEKTWTVDNTTASLPRIDPLRNDQYRLSDLQLVDLSYISLNNINLGYILDSDALKKHHINNIRIYGTVNNAFLLYSARQGYDPRLSVSGRSAAEYGTNRTIAFGVNITLN